MAATRYSAIVRDSINNTDSLMQLILDVEITSHPSSSQTTVSYNYFWNKYGSSTYHFSSGNTYYLTIGNQTIINESGTGSPRYAGGVDFRGWSVGQSDHIKQGSITISGYYSSVGDIPITCYYHLVNGNYNQYTYIRNYAGTTDNYVWVCNNGAWHKAIPWVCNNGAWHKAIPWVCNNGAWHKTST